ncbi:MAG: DUF1735 domain-containing protein [Bacteroidetes bacterium]|nr:DUF1735 domain-containing protein [Bacteroidota bacterium]MBS1539598.1 DUF1735 domain-containing protein [Bacteroidota bacterium]
MKSKNISFNIVLVTLVTLVLASACLKDDRYIDFSAVTPTAIILGETPGTAIAATLSGNATDTIAVTVTITGANAPSSNVILNLGVSQAAIDVYNKDTSHVAGVMLPSVAYSIPATVTVVAGKDKLGNNNRSATFKVVLTEASIPNTPGVNYVLPIAITGAPSGYLVSSNQGAILYNFYHNPYDGAYTSNGTRWNFNVATDYAGWDPVAKAPLSSSSIAAAIPWSFTTNVVTINAANSWAHIGQGSALSFLGAQNLKVNADNTVTITSTCPANDGSCASPLTLVAAFGPLQGPGAPHSTYNPITKTFDLYYQWTNSNGTFRVCHDVMVHQ